VQSVGRDGKGIKNRFTIVLSPLKQRKKMKTSRKFNRIITLAAIVCAASAIATAASVTERKHLSISASTPETPHVVVVVGKKMSAQEKEEYDRNYGG
jgi:hypothetical protein